MDLYYVILLGISVSLDAMFAGTAYGLKGVRVGGRPLIAFFAVTCCCTTIAMFCSHIIGHFFEPHTAMIAGAVLLLTIGSWNLLQEFLTGKDGQDELCRRQLTIPIGRLLVCIMAKPEEPDVKDNSEDISLREALLLGLALCIDNTVAIFAADLLGMLPTYTPIVMGLAQILLICIGEKAVNLFNVNKLRSHLPYMPGTILVILGLLRLR